jgi:hypothetical protein
MTSTDPRLANFRKADHPLGTHRRTPRYPHFATLILRSKTPVSQSEARAYNQLVDSTKDVKQVMTADSTKKRSTFCLGRAVWLGLGILLCGFPCWSQQAPVVHTAKSAVPDSRSTEPSTAGRQTDQQPSGSISGKVVDQTGANISGALVKLTQEGRFSSAEALSDDNGQFSLSYVAPGQFLLTITSPGLASQEFSGILSPGESYVTPIIMMTVATQVTEVHVALTPDQIVDAEIKEQEKQRVLGVIPNFYVSYVPNAAPLSPKHKFELAWKSAIDPVTFVAVGVVAGLDQAGDRWGAYGQGAQGYAKRFGATYADVFVGTFIGSAALPSLLKQDPRYFYKGSGTKRSRILYALASSLRCKGDNGRWQANYSSILGNLAAGGISNLYYPANDRNGVGIVFTNAMIRIGETAVANIFQEFIVPKLTPNLPTRAPAQP